MGLSGWHRARAAFTARRQRERALLVGAGVALLLLAGWLLWIEPAVVQRNRLLQDIGQRTAELEALQPRLDALELQSRDPNAGRKAQIALLRSRIDRVDADFARFGRSLAAPRDMGRLVEGLLKQHAGLQLLAWRSLPVAPFDELLAASAAGAAAGQGSAGGAAASGASSGRAGASPRPGDAAVESWLYLHGVEMSVGGSYADMQSWLQEVERLPRHVYWGPITVDAKAWPASVMTVTLYTVSLERTWWAL